MALNLTKKGLFAVWVVGGMWLVGLGEMVRADLQTVGKAPWTVSFAGVSNSRFDYAVGPRGYMSLRVKDRGDFLVQRLTVPIEVLAMTQGKKGLPALKGFDRDSLTSADAPKADFEKIRFDGVLGDGSKVGVVLESERNEMHVGLQLLEKGQRHGGQWGMMVEVSLEGVYGGKKKNAKALEALMEKVKKDSMKVDWIDGKSEKWVWSKCADATIEAVEGVGIQRVEVDMAAYQGRKLVLEATENTRIRVKKSPLRPWYEGYTLSWQKAPGVEWTGKERLVVSVR